MKRLKAFSFFIILALGSLLISPSISANPTGFFSEENFKALKENPSTLFSKTNACHLKSILGAKDYDLFNQAMSLTTGEDDAPNYLSISGNVRGLFTIFEGFFRMSKDGKVWIAYLFNNQVHYFTNDASTLNQPPKIMTDWSSRFKEAKWISTLVKVTPDNCK